VAALDATEESNEGKEMAEPVTMGLVEEEREEVEGEEIVVCSLQFCIRKDNVYAFCSPTGDQSCTFRSGLLLGILVLRTLT
jgi:hypothetical protein